MWHAAARAASPSSGKVALQSLSSTHADEEEEDEEHVDDRQQRHGHGRHDLPEGLHTPEEANHLLGGRLCVLWYFKQTRHKTRSQKDKLLLGGRSGARKERGRRRGQG